MTVIKVYAPTTDAKEAEADQSCADLEDLLELTPKPDVLFISGDWYAKEGSQEIPGVTGKFGLGEQNEAGKRLSSAKRMPSSEQIPFLSNTRDRFTH